VRWSRQKTPLLTKKGWHRFGDGVVLSLVTTPAVFARYLNISPRTVQSWEQGLGKPSGASLKLLSIAKKDPKILFEI